MLVEIPARLNDLTADSSMTRTSRRDRAYYDLLEGEIELAKRDYDEALDLFQLGNKISGGIRSSEPLAYCHLLRGDLDQAISMYQHIISLKELGDEDHEKWILAPYYLCENLGAGGLQFKSGCPDQSPQRVTRLSSLSPILRGRLCRDSGCNWDQIRLGSAAVFPSGRCRSPSEGTSGVWRQFHARR